MAKKKQKNSENYVKNLKGLDSVLSRAPALFSYPVLYDSYLLSQKEISSKIKKALESGIIKEIGQGFKFSDEPKIESFYAKHILEVESENLHGSSVDFDEQNAQIKAIGECFERFCLIKPLSSKKILASFEELSSLKKRAVNPTDCLNFEEKFISFSREKYEKILKNSKIKWVVGEDLINKEKAFLPSQLVFLPEIEELKGEPLIRIPITTGAACGENYEDAILRGIMECIERDSSSLTWLKKREIPRIILDTPFFSDIESYLKKYSLELFAWETTTDLGIPSIMAIIIDRTGRGVAVSAGTKTDIRLRKALLGAILEAIQGRLWIRLLSSLNNVPRITEKEVIDLPSRGLYWNAQNRINCLDFLFDSKKEKRISKIKEISCKNPLDFVLKRLKKMNINCYSIDISYPKMKDAGFAVARVIIPELHPMHLDDDMPYYYSKRLNKIEGQLNKIPAPYL